MKFSLDAVKNADWKQLAIDHGEKVGFAVALLIAAAVLFGTPWSPYDEKQPARVNADVAAARQDLSRSVWTDDLRAEAVPPQDVRDRANALLVKNDLDMLPLPRAFDGPLVPVRSKAAEPRWLAPEDVIVDYEELLVRLTDADGTAAGAEDDEGEAAEEEDGAPIEDEYNLGGGPAAGGGLPPGFGGDGMFGGGGMSEDEGRGPGDGGYGPPSGFGFGDAGGMSEDEGRGPGGFGGYGGSAGPKIDENARGRGVKVAAVRAVFPYRKQVQELAKALGGIPYAQAEARLNLLELQVQRQRAVPGPNPWAGDWVAVDRTAAEELLAEDGRTGKSREVVSAGITDAAITFPLLSRVYGFYEADRGRGTGTHPRISDFALSQEDQALQDRLLEQSRRQAEAARDRRAASAPTGPRRRVFGADLSADEIREELAGGDAADQQLLEQLNAVMVDNVLLLARFFDVAVEPGQMYRYRMRIAVANPNFGYGVADVEDPASLEGEERLTPWSEPSAPALIPDDEHVFLAGARGADDGEAPKADLEVIQYSREFGTLVRDTARRLIAGDLLTFEDRRAFVIDPVKGVYGKTEKYTFDTDQVVLDVFAPPGGAAELHPNLNLGGRDTPPGRVLVLAGTGAVNAVDATDLPRREAENARVENMREGLTSQLADRDAAPAAPTGGGYDPFGGEFGAGGEEEGRGGGRGRGRGGRGRR